MFPFQGAGVGPIKKPPSLETTCVKTTQQIDHQDDDHQGDVPLDYDVSHLGETTSLYKIYRTCFSLGFSGRVKLQYKVNEIRTLTATQEDEAPTALLYKICTESVADQLSSSRSQGAGGSL